jgi:hypothetical protein
MGRGQIISGGEDGLYNVKLIYNRERLNEMLADLAQKKTDLQETRAEVQQEWNDLDPQVDAALADLTATAEDLADKYSTLQVWQSQLNDLNLEIVALEAEKSDAQESNDLVFENMTLIEQDYPDTYETNEDWQNLEQQWTVGESNIDQLQNQIDEKKEERDQLNNDIGDLQKEIDELNETFTEQEKTASDLAYDLALLDQQLSAIDLNIAAIDKRVAYLNAECPADETFSAWCADLTEDLSGTVGTVEVPGEKQVVQIQPGYEGNAAYDEDRDGQLFFTPAMTPAQAFYNFAMLPGWQMWKPLFRYGTITDITDGLAAVTLDASMVSSGQDLNINQTTTLSGVAFDYMSCDDGAFEEGDEVLIKFENQLFANPVIVGFKEEPQPCEITTPYIAVSTSNYGEYGFLRCLGNQIKEDEAITEIDFSGPYELFSAFGPDNSKSQYLPYSYVDSETGETVVIEWQLTDFEKDGHTWTTKPFMAVNWDPVWCTEEHGGALDCEYWDKPHSGYLDQTYTRRNGVTSPDGDDGYDFWDYHTYTVEQTLGVRGGDILATASWQQWYEGDEYNHEEAEFWYRSGSMVGSKGIVVSQTDPSKYVAIYMTYDYAGGPQAYFTGVPVQINSITNAVVKIEGLGHSYIVPGIGYGGYSVGLRMYNLDGQYVCIFTVVFNEEDGNIDYGFGDIHENVYMPRSRQAFIGSVVEGGELTLVDVTDGLEVDGEMVDVVPGSASPSLLGIIERV